MATRTTDINRTFTVVPDPGYDDVPVIAADILYAGSAVGGNGSGYGRPLQGGDPFYGFNIARVDNSAGSAGDKNARVRTRGRLVANVTGVTGVGDKGSTVYMSDDDTFTLASTGGSTIGKISRHISGTQVEIEFEATPQRSL